MYKVDTLQTKFQHSLGTLGKVFEGISSTTGTQNIDELKIENHILIQKVAELEAQLQNKPNIDLYSVPDKSKLTIFW